MSREKPAGYVNTGQEPTFVDALQATSGLEITLPELPPEHGLRLLAALGVHLTVDPAVVKPCGCKPAGRGRR